VVKKIESLGSRYDERITSGVLLLVMPGCCLPRPEEILGAGVRRRGRQGLRAWRC